MKRILTGFLIACAAASATSSPVPRDQAAAVSNATVFVLSDGTAVEMGPVVRPPAHLPVESIAVVGAKEKRFFLSPDGSVLSWSGSVAGVAAAALPGDPVIALAGTDTGVLALRRSGRLVSLAGDGSSEVAIQGIPSLVALSASGSSVLAVDVDHRVWAWLSGVSDPTLVDGLPGVSSVSAGPDHNLAIDLDGTVWTWAKGLPQQVNGPAGVTAVAAGSGFDLVLAADGTVWSWGTNNHGQLGDGTRTPRLQPAPIAGLAGVAGISAGTAHSIATLTDGSIWGWGENGDGQLPDGGEAIDRLTPTRLNGRKTNHVATLQALPSAGGETALRTETPKATIRYTLDGTTPTETSEKYTSPIAIPEGSTLTARGFKPGLLPSDVFTKNPALASLSLASPLRTAAIAAPIAPLAPVAKTALFVVGSATLNTSDSALQTRLTNLGFTVTVKTAAASVTADATGKTVVVISSTVLPTDIATKFTSVTVPVVTWESGIFSNMKMTGTTSGTNFGTAATKTQVTMVATTHPLAAGLTGSPTVSTSSTYNWGSPATAAVKVANVFGSTTQWGIFGYATGATMVGLNAPARRVGFFAGDTTAVSFTANGNALFDAAVKWASNTAPTVSAGSNQTAYVPGTANLAGTMSDDGFMLATPTTTWSKVSGPGTVTFGTPSALTTTATFSVAGTYVLRLTANDGDLSATSDVTITAVANAAPTVNAGPDQTITLPSTAALSGTATDDGKPNPPAAVTVAWSKVSGPGTVTFGNANAVATTATFSVSGTYVLRLTGSDSLRSTTDDIQIVVNPQPAQLTFTPDAGTYPAGQVITLAANAGSTIYYTLDGSDPDGASPAVVSGSSLIAGNYTLKAIEYRSSDGTWGPVKTAVYNVTGQLTPGKLAGGGYHSLAARPDGTVWAWGDNSSYQIGDGTNVSKPSPTLTMGLTGVIAVAAQSSGSIALRNDGTVWTWGSSASGSFTRPVQVFGLTGITAISGSSTHVLALKSDGTVWAWGDNSSGELGDGSQVSSSTPVQVTGLTGTTAVAAAGYYSLALKADGTVWGWGINNFGFLGNGTTALSTVPVQAAGLTSVSQIAAGVASYAVKTDGSLWAWGPNNYGQLGDGTTTGRNTPALVAGFSNVRKIAAGNLHVLALKVDGTVWGWGWNASGQLGDGTTTQRLFPVQVMGLAAADIAAGHSHSLASKTDGSVWAWGENASGQVGDGTTVDATVPTKIAEPGFLWKIGLPAFNPIAGTYSYDVNTIISTSTPGTTIRYTLDGTDPTPTSPVYSTPILISTGPTVTVKAKATKAGMADSSVASATYSLQAAMPWSDPFPGNYTTPQTVTLTTDVVGGTIRYTVDGSDPTVASTLYSGPFSVATSTTIKARVFKSGWLDGYVGYYQYSMYFGTLAAPTFAPPTGPYVSPQTVTLTSIPGATIRYTTDGTAPTIYSTLYTGSVSLLTSTTLKAKAWHPDYTESAVATATFTVAAATPTISPAGGAYAPGQKLTIQDSTPGATLYYTLSGVDPTTADATIPSGGQIYVGNYTLKVKATKAGCVDSGVASATYTATGSATGRSIAAGGFHSLALRADGTVLGWGVRTSGALGDGVTTGFRTTPAPVGGLTGIVEIAAASGAGYHSLARRADGTLFGWGANTSGQLGVGTPTDRPVPVQVSIANVVSARAGTSHTIAVLADGTVWTWGSNTNGELGDGTTTPRTSPAQVPGLSGIVAVSAGRGFSVALKGDGTVWAWGINYYSSVGDGTRTDRWAPVRVDGLSSIVAIESGDFHSLARRDDGTLWAWGLNTSGQLGDGTTAARVAPVRVSGLPVVVGMSAGGSHSMAVSATGGVWTWGANASGQLGDGTKNARSLPFLVPQPTGVVRVAAGVGHSLALTSDGTLWAWGTQSWGALGDGTQLERLSPVRITDPDLTWLVATPTLSPAIVGVIYSTDQSITVDSATPGATIRYTTNGADPTPTDPSVVPGGTVLVDRSMTLKARAWKTGMSPGGVGSAQYTLQAVQPTMSPGGGSFTTAPTVALATTTSGATIRYTTDGSDPTAASTQYSGPFSMTATGMVKAKAFKNQWTDSTIVAGSFTLNYGALPAPTISPAGGASLDSVSVTMTAVAGSTIRYTTDGSTPSTVSTLYSGPVTLTTSATVKAIAVNTSYSPGTSAVSSQTYAIDTPAPSLSPGTGTYPAGQAVTVTGPAGATLRYTLNGVDPTATDAVIGTGTALRLQASATVKVRAFRAGANQSAVTAGVYTISGSATIPAVVVGGGSHSILRAADGTVWAWGLNTSAQLGTGATSQPVTTPVTIAPLASVLALAGGVNHTLALKADRTVVGVGANGSGQLGDSTVAATRANPVAAVGLGTMTAVSAHPSGDHALALRGDGVVFGCGLNTSAQVGNGSATSSQATPVPVAGLTGMVMTAVAAGGTHSLALKSDGTVWAWGGNGSGQVGNGTQTTPQLTPAQVGGLTGGPVTGVAAGNQHSLALRSSGTVVAWGHGGFGQMGDGQFQLRTSPVAVLGLDGVIAIAAGFYHNLALKSDGTVWAWGYNAYGQLGDGFQTNRASPVHVVGLSNIAAIAAGTHHSLAVGGDGTVWAWGYNASGQLGDGTLENRLTPVKISDSGLAWRVATPTLSLAGGFYYAQQNVTVATATVGAAIRYTTNGVDPTEADASVASGGTVTVDRSMTLKVAAFKPGMLQSSVAQTTYTLIMAQPTFNPPGGIYTADQTVTVSSSVPGTTIRYTLDGSAPTDLSPVYAAPIAVDRTMTVRAKGFKTGWQDNGYGTAVYTMKVATPTATPPAGAYATAQTVTAATTTANAQLRYSLNGEEPSNLVVPAGGVVIGRSAMLKVRGFRPGWTPSDSLLAGYSINLGTAPTPTFSIPPGSYTTVQSVGISTTMTGAIIRYTTDGSDPVFSSPLYMGPVSVDANMTLKARAFARDYTGSATAAATYTIALANTAAPVAMNPPAGTYTTRRTVTLTTATPGATIYYTTNGVDPTTSDSSVVSGGTVLVDRDMLLKVRAFAAGLSPSPVRKAAYGITGAVAGGYDFVLMLKTDGTVWGVGDNSRGQLGTGNTLAAPTPVQASTLTDIVAIAAGPDSSFTHGLALKRDGTVWAWGSNNNGQVGNNTTSATPQTTPVQVIGPADVVAIAAGRAHSLAVTSDGRVFAWGSNSVGELGSSTPAQSPLPIEVASAAGAANVAAGSHYSLVLKRDGTVLAWGENTSGELGDGTINRRSTPGPVVGLTGVTALTTGNAHSLALKTDGTLAGGVWAWGSSPSYGVVGDGTTGTNRLTPVRVVDRVLAISARRQKSLALDADVAGSVRILGWGAHDGNYFPGKIENGTLGGSSSSASVLPQVIELGDYAALAAGDVISVAVRADTTLVSWKAGCATGCPGSGFVLGLPPSGGVDPDGDGLSTAKERLLGTDPYNADTNGDGVPDGVAFRTGRSANNFDMDGDGLTNVVELQRGTDPFRADTDGDGVSDSLDAFPLDPTRSQAPTPTPGDVTPPVITLAEPTNATLISSVPPQ